MSTKWGTFGRSFEDVGNAIREKVTSFNEEFEQTGKILDSWSNSDSILKRLYPSKEDIQSQLIDVDSFIPEINPDSFDFDSWISELNDIDKQVLTGATSWQDYSNSVDDNQKWIAQWGQKTQGSIRTEEDFIQANKQARNALIEQNKALQQQTLGAKVATAATKALSVAGNMLVMWGISKAIEELTKLANASKIAEEKAASFANSVNGAVSNMSSNSTTLSSLNNEYKKLSEGVNALGENVSLSTSEYDRYKEVVKQISDIMPNMTTYFNSQGEKIAFAKGELVDLNDEYETYIQKQAKDFLVNGDDSGNTFQDTLDNFNNNSEMGFLENLWNTIQNTFGFYDVSDLPVDTMISTLESLQNKSREAMTAYLNDVERSSDGQYLQTMNNRAKAIAQEILNTSANEIYNMTDAEFNTLQESITNHIESLKNNIDVDMSAITSGLLQIAYSKGDFWAIDDENIRNDIITMLSSIDSETWESLGYTEQMDVENFVGQLITAIVNNTDGLSDAWNGLFDLNTEELPASEYIEQIDTFMTTIANYLGLDEDGKKQFMISLGFQTDVTQGMIEGLQERFDDVGDNWVNTLTESELELAHTDEFDAALEAQKDKLNGAALSAKDYEEALQTVKASQAVFDDVSFGDIFAYEDATGELTNLGKISKSIDTIQNAYKTLDDAIDEYNENGSISIDTLQSVIGLGDDWLHYLVDTEGNLSLNKEGLQKLTQSRLEDMRVQALNNLINNVGKIEDDISANEYLISTNYALADSYEALAKQNLYNKLEKLKLDPDISDEMYAKIEAQALGDMEKINNLFNNTDFSTDLSLGGGSGGSSTSDASEELIDFIERRIEVLNEANSLLEANLENVNGSFAKNTLIDSQLGIAEESFRNYTDSLSMYSELANAALSALPTDLAEKVKNGSLSITSEDSDLVELINEYDKWSDKVAECEQELAKLKENIRQLELDKFNNIIEDFTNQFDIYENANELIKKQISLFEEAGELIGKSFYTTQLEESQKQLALLEKEKTTLVNQLNSALSSGRIQAGTDEWFEMINALSDVDGSILECKTSIEELDNAILDLHTEVFERIQNQFSNLNSELENLYGLFDEDTAVTDGNQNWTDAALAQLGLLAQQYELSQYQIQQYDKEIEQLNSDYINGKYSTTEYADKLADLSSAQWDAVNSSESIKDSIVDLNQTRIDEIVEGIEEEINAYQELTNAQIDALDAEKELHDYEESIAEKTKSVTNLERQIAAMQNDTTAATVAKRLQLEEELAQAKKDLENAEYEHSLESQKEALNQQYEDYETSRNEEIAGLEESLNDKETLIYNSFEAVKENSNIVGSQIAAIATQHGIRVSDSLISSWKSGENAIASYGFVLSQNSSAFIGNIMGIETEFWMLQNKANETSGTLSYMFSTQADTLISELEQSYDSEYNLANMTSALQSSLINTLEGPYDISNIVDALDIIAEKARAAAEEIDKIGDDSDSSVVKNNETWKIVNAQTGTPVDNVSYSSSTDALEKLKEYNKNGGGYTIKKYAAGTRNSNGGLIIKDEEGYELTLPKLSNGRYAIANEGTQILTKAQTDNIFDWSKENPNNYHTLSDTSNIFLKTIPLVIKRENDPPTMNYVVHVDGDVNNSNIKQIEAAVQDGLHKFATQINRDYRYGRK